MSTFEWILVIALVAALLIVLLMVSAAHRARDQWADAMLSAPEGLAEPTKISGSVDISTFIGPDGLPYISAADTKRLGEEASRTMANRRRVKVYQPTPGNTYGNDAKVYYGQAFTGRAFEHIELVDPPKDQADMQWMREHLMTRIAPGGKLRLSKDMVPHAPSPSSQWKVGDEIVSVHSEAGTVVISKATADRMGIQGKAGKVVDG